VRGGRPRPDSVRHDLVRKGRRRERHHRAVEAVTLPKVHSAISAVASAIEVRRSTESTPMGLKTLSTKLVRVNDAGEIQVYVVLTEWRPSTSPSSRLSAFASRPRCPRDASSRGGFPVAPLTTSQRWTRSRK
jgi:hypothetical protein